MEIGLIATIIVGISVIAWLLIHTLFVKTTVVNMNHARLPALTIVHISDLHGRTRFLNGTLHRLIHKWQPDLVCVTGDLTQHEGQLEKVMREIAKIQAKDGIFFVPGNYEREELQGFRKRKYSNSTYNRMKLVWQQSMIVLENCGASLSYNTGRLEMYGFDNSEYGNERYTHEHDGKGNEKAFTLFLAHSPNIISYINRHELTADLLLTGHTHGGQIRILGKTAGAYKHFHVGAKEDRQVRIFAISRGLGTTKIPVRMHCFPEITIYRINKNGTGKVHQTFASLS